MSGRNLAASVRARLLNRARETRQDFNLILTRYALERLLYRLSISPHADQFLLKGALLFDLWFDIPHRPTRDADFLGLGSGELPHLETIFRDVCMMDAEDGMMFRPDTIQAAEIRKEANYAGVRVTFLGLIDGARCPIQVDIGFGDAVTPGPEEVRYPVMLPEFEAPKLRVYPRYTVVAEKLEAMAGVRGKEQARSAGTRGSCGSATGFPASCDRRSERRHPLPALLAGWRPLDSSGGLKPFTVSGQI